MDERLARIISNTGTFESLAQFEANARRQNALTDEVKEAIRAQSAVLGRTLISGRTGVDLADLSPAEEKIVQAISEYAGVQTRKGSNANRTLDQVRNRGLIDAAETSVTKSKPTQGFKALADADLSDLSYEQIVVDHSDEFSPRALWYSRRTLGLPNESDKPPAKSITPVQQRTERLLTWLRQRSVANNGHFPSFTNAEAAAAAIIDMTDMHRFGRVFGNIQSRIDFACYSLNLPPLGLAADEPFDKAWDRQNRDWAFPIENMQSAAKSHVWSQKDFDLVLRETERLPGQAHISWKRELSINEAKVRAWAFGLKSKEVKTVATVNGERDAGETPESHIVSPITDAPYWVFVCNPKKWAIDKFFDRSAEHDTWGVRPSDRERFGPGQLGIIRVGVDRRSIADRNGKPPLEPGVYALVEVESEAFAGTGAGDEFWAPGEGREPGWPTVKLRYLRTYLDKPLTIERLKAETPGISKLLLNGFQAASFPIPAGDFRTVMTLLGENPDEPPTPVEELTIDLSKLAGMEQKYLHASPEVKERLSRTIERGPIGALVKKATGFKCQLCEALGLNPIGFLKTDGEPYVEAHHATPASKREIGSLAASNIMTLCPNHHRQMHYGGINVVINPTTFDFIIDGLPVTIPRLTLDPSVATPIRASAA
jgi:hypothetical protein